MKQQLTAEKITANLKYQFPQFTMVATIEADTILIQFGTVKLAVLSNKKVVRIATPDLLTDYKEKCTDFGLVEINTSICGEIYIPLVWDKKNKMDENAKHEKQILVACGYAKEKTDLAPTPAQVLKQYGKVYSDVYLMVQDLRNQGFKIAAYINETGEDFVNYNKNKLRSFNLICRYTKGKTAGHFKVWIEHEPKIVETVISILSDVLRCSNPIINAMQVAA